jgi:thioredoxin-like negative regulator of GroEL
MMSRRPLLATLVALPLGLGLFTAPASALELQPYSAPALAAAQQAGQPVALHFHADWCPTCRQQTKVLQQFKAQGALPLTVLVVDYDQAKALRQSLQVRMQSTLIVYKGARETARLAGETAPEALRSALQSAL